MNGNELPRTGHLLVTGIVSSLLGIIAIATPALAGKAVVIVIGAALLCAGIVQIVQGFRADSWSAKLPPFVLGVLTGLFALAVLAHPLLGLKFLTLLLAAYFIVMGVSKIVASFSFRADSGWLLMLGSGLVSLLLGGLIWMQWPLSGMWAVGVLVGVDLLISGISMIALATTIHHHRGVAAGGSMGMPHGTA